MVSASCRAGATRPPVRNETATPRWTPAPGTKASSTQSPFRAGSARAVSATALSRSTAGRSRAGRRALPVGRLQPAQGRGHVDVGRHVVVRHLAIGAGHQVGDGAPHRDGPVTRRGRSWRRPRRARPATAGSAAPEGASSSGATCRALDVGPRDGAVGSGPGDGLEIDAEVLGEAPHDRGGLSGVGRTRRRRGRGWRGRTSIDSSTRGSVVAAAVVGSAEPFGDGAVELDDRQRRPDRDALADRDEELVDDAGLEDLDIDVGLVGVDDGDDVAAAHLVAGLHPPLDDRPGLHVGAEGRHAELSHEPPPREPRR